MKEQNAANVRTKGTKKKGTIRLDHLKSCLLGNLVYILIGAVLAGTILYVFDTLFRDPVYTAVTSVCITDHPVPSDGSGSSDQSASAFLAEDYMQMIHSRIVAGDVTTALNLGMSIDQLLDAFTVSLPAKSRIIQISAQDKNPYQAMAMADMIRVKAMEHIRNVTNTEALTVVDEAGLPSRKTSPRTLRDVLLSGLIGALLTAAYYVMRSRSSLSS